RWTGRASRAPLRWDRARPIPAARPDLGGGRPLLRSPCYNAAKTVEAFNGRLRDQINLDTLCVELLATDEHAVSHTGMTLHAMQFRAPPHPRSGRRPQLTSRLRVTVTVRWIPLVTAAYGTRARPARTTIVPLAPARWPGLSAG